MMRSFRGILITFIVAFVTLNASAQGSFAIGPKVGLNLSNFRGDDADDISSRTGIAGGIFLHFVPSENGVFAISPEILYQNRGGIIKLEAFDLTQEFRINYLTIAVPLKLRLPLGETFYPNIFIGPEFDILLSDVYTIEHDPSGVGVDFEDLETRDIDVNGIFGAGLDIESGFLFFNFELRYNL